MIIAYDLRYASDHFPGVGTYAYWLMRGLLAQPGGERYQVLWDPQARNTRFELDPIRRDIRVIWVERSWPALGIGSPWRVGRMLRHLRPTLYFSPFFLRPFGSGCPCVLVLHDVLALRLRQGGDWAGRLLYRLALSQTLRADRLLTVSEFSRREILASLPVEPARLVVVPPGVRPQGGASAARRPAAMPGGPFALTVGINKPHKNLGMLLEAWRLLGSAPPLHLVVVGPESARYPSTATLAQRADARGVTTLGRVSEDELEWLYRNATLLVFPSLYEGFGSPVLEALAHGLPAVVSDIPALREVAGAAARFVPPHDPTAWAGEVRSLAGDPAARETLSAAGLRQARTLTYSRTAAEVMAVLRDVAGEEARA